MAVEDSLKRMAEIAGRRKGRTVKLPSQSDNSMMWKATAVHPLQPMQNVHQRLVRDALGKLSATDLRDEDIRQAAETAEIEKYFVADSAEPATYGEPKTAPPLFVEQELKIASDRLKKLVAAAQAAVTTPPPASPVPAFQVELKAIVAQLEVVRGYFTRAKPTGVTVVPKALSDIDTAVATEKGDIDTLADSAGVLAMGKKLAKDAVKAYEEVLTGFCSIQMMHNIEPFYLFRLMVKFSMESMTPITPKQRKEVSGELTGLLNNAQRWTFDWLSACIKDLDTALKTLDATNLLFFLKGGRALKYLEKDALNGENDWDTQVVINPELPIDEWYELLRKVHNVVITKLKFYKLGFYQLLHEHSGTFNTSLATPLGAAPVAAAAPTDPTVIVSCKAELIDIGIPRVDTVEAFEQWVQMKGKIETEDGVPIPGFIYYINEYVLMIREAFAETSISIIKTPKRTVRLNGILGVTKIADVARDEKAKIPTAAVPKALAAIDTLATDPLKRVFTVLLRQFVAGYDLANDPGFAAAFDGLIDAEKANMATKAAYPTNLTDAIGAEKRKTPLTWDDAIHKPLCDVIGFGNYLSQQCEKHLTARSTFLLKQRKIIGGLIKAVYTASVVNPDEELQIQIGVSGNFAAFLHAHYLNRLTADQDESSARSYDALEDSIIKAFHDKVGIVDVIDVTIYCWKKDYDPDAVLEAVLLPHLRAYVANPRTPQFDVQLGPPGSGSVYVFWPQAETLDTFSYKPVVLKFSVDKHPARWPQLSFIWGYPVLGMRDLINDFHRRCAHVDEFGAQQRLKKTAAKLVEMMTHYEYPVTGGHVGVPSGPPTVLSAPFDSSPSDDAVATAITAGTCHHLTISSVQQSSGDTAKYPDGLVAPKHLFTLPKPAQAGGVKTKLTIPADLSKDRILDLLVVNHGQGAVDSFAGWTGAALGTNVVAPLVAAGVKAQTIVLDFASSASLAYAFAPLCNTGGKIICTMHGSAGLVVGEAQWTAMDADLQARRFQAIRDALVARITEFGRAASIEANYRMLRKQDTLGKRYVAEVYLRSPDARDRVSIVRCLPAIADALANPPAGVPGDYWQALYNVKQSGNTVVSDEDLAILTTVSPEKGRFETRALTAVKAAFRARVVSILTSGPYAINVVSATLDGKAEVGAGSVWEELTVARRRGLLASLRGLLTCPGGFAIYDETTKAILVDKLYAGTMLDRPRQLLESLYPRAAPETVSTRSSFRDHAMTASPQDDYLV